MGSTGAWLANSLVLSLWAAAFLAAWSLTALAVTVLLAGPLVLLGAWRVAWVALMLAGAIFAGLWLDALIAWVGEGAPVGRRHARVGTMPILAFWQLFAARRIAIRARQFLPSP